ncbi:TetR/AcrR family transcriptional regulator [Streptomyces parvulus]|uniref:TetR/AcrR family transcriptional regulator n=1 Tax=Streptomyces parvulus TaxID=146923 RepID=A0A369VKA0_9ACTN|nr:TetR/AcrR family transcriptional regulator [Streptomyces parvulus]RDD90989.1 TetR/AcrR family transcriptional regulator [Streptomyces parvulus]
MSTQRSDARRNYQRILEVAEAEVATHGADASVEQIARTAGVGSATVRRHFPTRRALLTAVFQERIEHLIAYADGLRTADDSRSALLDWLRTLLDYAVSARGLADALAYEPPTDRPTDHSCGTTLEAAGAPLLARAISDRTVNPALTPHDLITLTVGIALATEHHSSPATEATHLLHLLTEGLTLHA